MGNEIGGLTAQLSGSRGLELQHQRLRSVRSDDLLAERRTDHPSLRLIPNLLSAFGLIDRCSLRPQPQSPERFGTPQEILNGGHNPSLLGAFGLTDRLQEQVQRLDAEPANY